MCGHPFRIEVFNIDLPVEGHYREYVWLDVLCRGRMGVRMSGSWMPEVVCYLSGLDRPSTSIDFEGGRPGEC